MTQRLTLAQACEHLGMSRERVRRQVDKGGLRAIDIGAGQLRKLVFDVEELDRYLREGPTKPEHSYRKKPQNIKQYVTAQQVEGMRKRMGFD